MVVELQTSCFCPPYSGKFENRRIADVRSTPAAGSFSSAAPAAEANFNSDQLTGQAMHGGSHGSPTPLLSDGFKSMWESDWDVAMSQSYFPFASANDIRHQFNEARTGSILPYSTLRIGLPYTFGISVFRLNFESVDDVLPAETEGRAFVSRMLLQPDDLFRVIGSGGNHLSIITERTGCSLLTSDLHGSNEKILIISGGFRQVTEAFDLVLDVMTFTAFANHECL